MKGRIVTAKNSGFCFGVKRAIDIAENTVNSAGKNSGRKRSTKRLIYSLGPLIHNPQEVKRLEKKGIKVVENPSVLKNATLILRTHGIPQGLKEKLRFQNLTLVDATCPFVKKAQDIVQKLALGNEKIIIVGERKHPEVKALVSYGGDRCFVVEKDSDLRDIDFSGSVAIVSQTTQSPENFSRFVKIIKELNPKAKTFDTICRATFDRQTSARKLSKRADAMVIVGGKNSGNTKRLAQICSEFTKTYYVETAKELKSAWFKGKKIVGISAGASTPGWIVREVKKKLEGFLKEPPR